MSITPLFFKLNTSNQNYNYPGRHIGSVKYQNQHMSVQKFSEKPLNTVTMVTKKNGCAISH